MLIPNDLDAKLLADFIKEDRTEIRLIKNRIYTYIQVLIGASFTFTAFFIGKSMDKGVVNLTPNVKEIIVFTNIAFLVISWIIFYFQNKDLQFVRRCLTDREKKLEAMGVNYFENCDDKLPNWCKKFLKKFWPTEFINDSLLFIPMCLLTLIYAGVIVTVCFYF